MELKSYQQEAVDILEHFCKEYSRTQLFEEAFMTTKKEFGQNDAPYLKYEGLNAPNVCFRIPTGGGKTLLASHSIPTITFDLLNAESSLVFWLAPTRPIVKQTIDALKDLSHPYRQILEERFHNRTVKIYTVQEALVQSFDLTTELPVIIGTNQVFSVEEEEGRKFYELNPFYEEHFEFVSKNPIFKDLEGFDKPSLYNAIRTSNPIVIVDEAHNSKSELRVSSIIKLNPSFVLELTATPQREHRPAEGKYANNIIYSISASQLKSEDMIKLPIVVETVDKWQIAIKDAIEKRLELEKIAKDERLETGEKINPIVLFKADRNINSNSITYDKVLQVLTEDYGISRDEIAIHTGDYEELNEKDDYKYVITVDKLKEGWDKPDAYILSVMGDINSPTAVEQILGRILRLPSAKKKHHKELEKAYAFIASNKTFSVIKNLKDSLIGNGFEEMEADLSISYSPNSNKEADIVLGGLFEDRETKIKLDMEKIDNDVKEFFTYNQESNNFRITKSIPVSKIEKVKKSIIKGIVSIDDIKKIDEILTPEPKQNRYFGDFTLPKLLINYHSELFEFDKTILLDSIDWDDKEILMNAILTEDEFNITVRRETTEIDINDNQKIQYTYLTDVKENLFSLSGDDIKLNEIDITKLVLRHIDHTKLQSLGSRQLQKLVHGMILDLTEIRKISTIDLKSNLFMLTEKIFNKIKELEKKVIKEQYNTLFQDRDIWEVNVERSFSFDRDNYPTTSELGERASFLKKHFYERIDKMNGEEFDFAKWLDDLPEVECWVRNMERNIQYSFWLQTSTDKFYPDFIAKLTNGKYLVIEYKGDQLDNKDTEEKTKLGKMWASLSDDVEYATVFKSGEFEYKKVVKELIKKLGM